MITNLREQVTATTKYFTIERDGVISKVRLYWCAWEDGAEIDFDEWPEWALNWDENTEESLYEYLDTLTYAAAEVKA